MFREVLPNCAAPLIVQASLGVSTAILDAAALGFLGLGAQPPAAEWGTMLADAREFVLRAWWVVTFPGLMILVTVLAFNLLGDGLRDALDPEVEALSASRMALARNRRPARRVPARKAASLHAVEGVSLTLGRGRGAGHRRRIGLGQERDDARADGPGRLPGPGARAAPALRRPRPAALSDRERRALIGQATWR